ncbi:hypothetical protein [Citrobacter phage Tr1]|nr:hypothetical protein [Citrobacter phage Tr1]
MAFILFLVAFVVAFFIMLIPSWLLLLAYNYIVEIAKLDVQQIPVTFLSVLCVAFILAILRGLFSRKG